MPLNKRQHIKLLNLGVYAFSSVLMIGILFFSCKKKSDSIPPLAGKWYVNKYIDSFITNSLNVRMIETMSDGNEYYDFKANGVLYKKWDSYIFFSNYDSIYPITLHPPVIDTFFYSIASDNQVLIWKPKDEQYVNIPDTLHIMQQGGNALVLSAKLDFTGLNVNRKIFLVK